MKPILIGTAGLLLLSAGLSYARVDRVPAGTNIEIRTNEGIDLRDASDGRIYTATVHRDVLDQDGSVAIPRGAQAELIVRNVGRDDRAVDLESVIVDGRRYVVDAEKFMGSERDGVGENKRTGKYVGGGAILGAIVGAVAGGGKGAAIGAAAGAATGAGAQTVTRGRSIRVPAESILNFQLSQPLRVVEGPDNGVMRDGRHYHDNYR